MRAPQVGGRCVQWRPRRSLKPRDRCIETLLSHLLVGIVAVDPHVRNAIDSDIKNFPTFGGLAHSKIDRNNCLCEFVTSVCTVTCNACRIRPQRQQLEPIRGPVGDRTGVRSKQPLVKHRPKLLALLRRGAAPMQSPAPSAPHIPYRNAANEQPSISGRILSELCRDLADPCREWQKDGSRGRT